MSIVRKGRLLQAGAPRSIRHYAVLMAQACLAGSWPHLLHSVQTGESAQDNPVGAYSWFARFFHHR